MPIDFPKVSVITVNYGHSRFLEGYLQSLLASSYPISEIIVVDNHSADHSVEILKKYPQVQVIENPENLGYSQALNIGIERASSPLVCITGPDVVVDPNWLSPLVSQYLIDPPSTFAVASRVDTLDRKSIQYLGGSLHFTGHLCIHRMWQPVSDIEIMPTAATEVGAIDSTSALIDRAKYLAIGGCDPDFFVYHEEFDYCYRARMRGWKCWFQPESMVYHGTGTSDYSVRGQGDYPRMRPFLHTRNRLLSILKDFQLRTIIVSIPAFILVDGLYILLLWKKGLQASYFQAWKWIINNWQETIHNRRVIQRERRLSDRLLLTAHPLTVSSSLVGHPALGKVKMLIDLLLSGYWRLIKIICYR